MMRQVRRISPCLLLLFVAVPQAAHAQQRDATRVALPRLEQLEDGWNRLVPGGRTSCVIDTNYHFFVRRGDPERLLVYFQGGGACWNGETCAQGEPVYKPDLRNDPERPQEGILDLRHPENPFAGYSMVFVSSCTGDVHLGHADTTYTVRAESGATRQLAIRHRGHVNALAVFEWVFANFRAPREIFVAGTSAGAVATPFLREPASEALSPGARRRAE